VKVAAIPKSILFSAKLWRKFIQEKRKEYPHFMPFNYYDHETIENCAELIQPIVFVMFCLDFARNSNYFCVFDTPDGRKSYGIPCHITDKKYPGLATVSGSFPIITNTDFSFSCKFSIPEGYTIHGADNECFSFPEIDIEYSQSYLAGLRLFWGKEVLNHSVHVVVIDASKYLNRYIPDSYSYLFKHTFEFLAMSDIDELSELVVRREYNWMTYTYTPQP